MSCLFDSLQILLKVDNLRFIVCDYMENNKNNEWLECISLDKYNEINVQRYIDEMKQNTCWGGAPEISIISKIFNIKIIVHDNNHNLIIFENYKYKENNSYSTINIKWTGNHYTHLIN